MSVKSIVKTSKDLLYTIIIYNRRQDKSIMFFVVYVVKYVERKIVKTIKTESK